MLAKKKTRQSKVYSQQILPLHGKTLSLRWLNSTQAWQLLGSSRGDRQQKWAARAGEGGGFLISLTKPGAILGRDQAYGPWLSSTLLWSRWVSVYLLFVNESVLTHKDRMPWEHKLYTAGTLASGTCPAPRAAPHALCLFCSGGHPRMALLCYCLSNEETEAQRGQVVRLSQA